MAGRFKWGSTGGLFWAQWSLTYINYLITKIEITHKLRRHANPWYHEITPEMLLIDLENWVI